MSTRPLDTNFTPREMAFGGLVATTLWLLSIALLVTLTAWSVAPGEVA